MRTAVAAVVTVLATLTAAPASADPSPTPPPIVPSITGPVLPGNQVYPPICGEFPRACNFTYDPSDGVWKQQEQDP